MDEKDEKDDESTNGTDAWFWVVVLCFALAFCNGPDGTDMHDALIKRVNK